MRSTLTQIYFGELDPHSETISNRTYEQAARDATDIAVQLGKSLTAEQNKLFRRFSNSCRIMENCTGEDKFISGFRYGFRLALDCLTQER